MAAGSNVTLSLKGIGATFVEITIANQSASETGYVEIFYGAESLKTSESVTVYQASTSVVISGLASGREYTAKFYSETNSVYSESTVTFSTFSENKIYGSVNDKGKILTGIYGSASNQSQRITKLYGPTNGQAKLIHQGFGHLAYTVYGTVTYYTDSTRTTTRTVPLLSQEEVDSLHGVSGASNAWSANIGNGTATVSNENICGVILNERVTSIPARFLKGCTYLTSINISEARLTRIPNYFMLYCKNFNSSITLPSTITSIGDNFLASSIGDDAENIFNQDITIPEGVTSIGSTFLSNNVNFNGTITLPSTLVSIGLSFLYSCHRYNKDLTLPQGITSIDTSFLSGMRDMTSTVNVGNLSATITPNTNLSFPFSAVGASSAAYTTGIRIAGASRAEWLSKYANSSSSPYRKLVDAGY